MITRQLTESVASIVVAIMYETVCMLIFSWYLISPQNSKNTHKSEKHIRHFIVIACIKKGITAENTKQTADITLYLRQSSAFNNSYVSTMHTSDTAALNASVPDRKKISIANALAIPAESNLINNVKFSNQ
jgi:hypothetical protein